jgi:hypothetical protein
MAPLGESAIAGKGLFLNAGLSLLPVTASMLKTSKLLANDQGPRRLLSTAITANSYATLVAEVDKAPSNVLTRIQITGSPIIWPFDESGDSKLAILEISLGKIIRLEGSAGLGGTDRVQLTVDPSLRAAGRSYGKYIYAMINIKKGGWLELDNFEFILDEPDDTGFGDVMIRNAGYIAMITDCHFKGLGRAIRNEGGNIAAITGTCLEQISTLAPAQRRHPPAFSEGRLLRRMVQEFYRAFSIHKAL